MDARSLARSTALDPAHDPTKAFPCSMCNSPVIMPYFCTDCRTLVCSICWKNPLNCPKNCSPTSSQTGPLFTKGFYKNIQFPCLNKDRGCEEVLKLATFAAHEDECQFQIRKCEFYHKCQKVGSIEELIDHVESCGKAIDTCTQCEKQEERSKLADHMMNTCEKKPLVQQKPNPKKNNRNTNGRDRKPEFELVNLHPHAQAFIKDNKSIKHAFEAIRIPARGVSKFSPMQKVDIRLELNAIMQNTLGLLSYNEKEESNDSSFEMLGSPTGASNHQNGEADDEFISNLFDYSKESNDKPRKSSQIWNSISEVTITITSILLPDDETMILGDDEGRIHLFEGGSLKTNQPAHEGKVTCLHRLTGNSFASGSSDSTIKIWDYTINLKMTLKDNCGPIQRILHCHDRIFSVSSDGSIKAWNQTSGSCISTLNDYDRHHPYAVDIVGLTKIVCTSATNNKVINVWKLNKGVIKHSFSGHSKCITAVVKLFDDNIASSSLDRSIRIWDYKLKECKKVIKGHTVGVYALVELRSGKLASASFDGTIKIWKSSGTWVKTINGNNDGECVISEIHDNILVSTSTDAIKAWDLLDGKCVYTVEGDNAVIKTHGYLSPKEKKEEAAEFSNNTSEETIKPIKIYNV